MTDKLVLPVNATELKEFQATIDDMVTAFQTYKNKVATLDDLITRYESMIGKLEVSNISLTELIKNFHIVMNANNEIWTGNEQIEVMMKEIAKFILSVESLKVAAQSTVLHR